MGDLAFVPTVRQGEGHAAVDCDGIKRAACPNSPAIQVQGQVTAGGPGGIQGHIVGQIVVSGVAFAVAACGILQGRRAVDGRPGHIFMLGGVRTLLAADGVLVGQGAVDQHQRLTHPLDIVRCTSVGGEIIFAAAGGPGIHDGDGLAVSKLLGSGHADGRARSKTAAADGHRIIVFTY